MHLFLLRPPPSQSPCFTSALTSQVSRKLLPSEINMLFSSAGKNLSPGCSGKKTEVEMFSRETCRAPPPPKKKLIVHFCKPQICYIGKTLPSEILLQLGHISKPSLGQHTRYLLRRPCAFLQSSSKLQNRIYLRRRYFRSDVRTKRVLRLNMIFSQINKTLSTALWWHKSENWDLKEYPYDIKLVTNTNCNSLFILTGEMGWSLTGQRYPNLGSHGEMHEVKVQIVEF